MSNISETVFNSQKHTMLFRFTAYALVATFFVASGFVPTHKKQTGKPPLTIVTDNTWDVSGQKTKFGEYPLSAERIASPTSPLLGGTYKAVAAEHNGRGKLVPGTVPIWRNRKADGEGEAYQFRKTVTLGAEPIQKITLEINCDDVARVYINKRLVSVEKRDGKLKDGYDKWFLFRSVSGFMFDRIYTYDVTDYFFTNVTNTILVEAVSLAFDGSHAYLSAKIVIEFAPTPEPTPPAKAAAPAKPKPEAKPNTKVETQKPVSAKPTADKENTVFEAGRDPEIEKLRVGSTLELGHVYFKADSYQLDTASYRTLAALASFMKRHPGLKIEVGGHTNLRPSDRFATELSTNRARSVMRYLTDNGVEADRVTYKGYGKTQPRINVVSEEADRANQRVEVKVLAK
ncbi:MAG: OmpA family protein [Saprospiraceae bacterium]|nr:OmpA family protein [Saprospiraceae bacterium]